MQVRFTGGPFYWRKRRRGTLLNVSPETDEIQVVGLVRPMKYSFRSIEEFETDAAKGAVTFRIGVYRRVEPDRFRWVGWT